MCPRRNALAILTALAVAACGGSSPAPAADSPANETQVSETQSTASSETSPPPLERFSKKRAMRHLRKLARDIGVRVRATAGERRGARYIARRFRDLGYRVNVQEFPVDGGTSRNVVAWWPDAKKYPFVIGGHMDTVESSPGANDNASGVAVILEMARLFADRPEATWVRFVAFGSEEYGDNGVHHVGSAVYVKRLGREGRNRLAGMLSVDMVADGRPLLIGHSGISEPVVARSIYRKVKEAGIGTRWLETCDCSDNGPFERAGIPASFMWSGDEPNYHDSSDTVPNMSPRDLARTGRAVRVFIRQLDRRLLEYYRRKG